MEDLGRANKRLKTARDDHEREYEAQIAKLDEKENALKDRVKVLNDKKAETTRVSGNVDASADDLVEINAGGKIIAANRSTLTQLKGTRFEALFSGRWDKELQRDSQGRIFVDVDSVCFQAIVDYLAEMAISSEDDPPTPPSVNEEHKHSLGQQLNLFRLRMPMMHESNIVKTAKEAERLRDWLKEGDSNGELELPSLYRGSRDGFASTAFHSNCDNRGQTLTVIETTDGYILGGYSNLPWKSNGDLFQKANKAFLFVLSGSDIAFPYKMKLKNPNDTKAVYHSSSYGPSFGSGFDIKTQGSTVSLKLGQAFQLGPEGRLTQNGNGSYATFAIKELEVFQVREAPSAGAAAALSVEDVSRFTDEVNGAINAKQKTLLRAEAEIRSLEESFEDEQKFIATFATGDAKDVVALNVCGTVMTTKRSTLQTVEDSVLAQQFDDSKWTEKGVGHSSRVKEWTPDDVNAWAKSIEGIQEDVGGILKDNGINGSELLALEKDGLAMLGIERTGTLCLLLKEIKMLQQASSDVVTLIEHSPYCFGKVVDFLRWKQLHSQGLAEEPALPEVCDAQKSRFEKVVRYYFPGESAKLILG